jgi:hypothetical protein
MSILQWATEITATQWCSLLNPEYVMSTRQDEAGRYWVVYKIDDKYVKIHMFV